LDVINNLRGVEFAWKKNGKKSAGVIAQEMEKVLPYAVQKDSRGYEMVEYNALSAYFIESIKELDGKIEGLNENIKQQKDIIQKQQEQINDLLSIIKAKQ